MIYFVVYTGTGFVKRTGTAPNLEMALIQGGDQEHVIITDIRADDPNVIYVSDNVVVSRPTQLTTLSKLTLTADGVDTVTISSAPSGIFTATNTTTRESVSGAINCTDTFATTIPGTYKIKVESWPFLSFEATINAI